MGHLRRINRDYRHDPRGPSDYSEARPAEASARPAILPAVRTRVFELSVIEVSRMKVFRLDEGADQQCIDRLAAYEVLNGSLINFAGINGMKASGSIDNRRIQFNLTRHYSQSALRRHSNDAITPRHFEYGDKLTVAMPLTNPYFKLTSFLRLAWMQQHNPQAQAKDLLKPAEFPSVLTFAPGA